MVSFLISFQVLFMFIFNTRELSVERKDLQPSTLVGQTQENLAQDFTTP